MGDGQIQNLGEEKDPKKIQGSMTVCSHDSWSQFCDHGKDRPDTSCTDDGLLQSLFTIQVVVTAMVLVWQPGLRCRRLLHRW